MHSKQWSFALIHALLAAAITLVLVPGASAKPKFKVLKNVPGALFSGLTLDAEGNPYGVTNGGGPYQAGTVFELARNSNGGWKLTTLHTFDGTDGSEPNGGMIFDSTGNLYGTTADGGAHTHGTAFELTPGASGWTFTDFYDFCKNYPYNCDDGQNATAGFVLDSAGNLYGSAGGGTCQVGYGVAFEFTPEPGGWNENILFDWGCRNYDTSSSGAPLIFDRNGNLYGTGANGRYHSGTVFELTHASGRWKEHLLYQFCPRGFPCVDGAGPHGVTFHGTSRLYGTTPGGGVNRCGEADCGTVFTVRRSREGQWSEQVIYSFQSGETGNTPTGGVVFDKKGNIYGTAAQGGSPNCNGGCGVIYQLAPQSNGKWKYTVLHGFTGTDGGFPMGGVALDKSGNLYGTAYNVVFEITP